jgi:hypothetical protein
MPAENRHGFPWGDNNPSLRARLIFALLLGLAAGAYLYGHLLLHPSSHTDFSQARFGADALLHGANPYALAGPGLVFDSPRTVLYPAFAYAAAIPFTLFTDHIASALFVCVSTFLLAFGATKGSWHRLPMFPSMAFIMSVQLAQWSTLMTAAFFIPVIAFFGSVKPQSIIPVLAGNRSRAGFVAAVIGTVVLGVTSFVLIPSWPTLWWAAIRGNHDLAPPVLRLGGVVILIVLLRWRRPESWLIATMALMPQTWGWYNVLLLLVVADTYREACILSLVSSAGAWIAVILIDGSAPATYPDWGAMMVAFAYLPAVIAVLRRPNVEPAATVSVLPLKFTASS